MKRTLTGIAASAMVLSRMVETTESEKTMPTNKNFFGFGNRPSDQYGLKQFAAWKSRRCKNMGPRYRHG